MTVSVRPVLCVGICWQLSASFTLRNHIDGFAVRERKFARNVPDLCIIISGTDSSEDEDRGSMVVGGRHDLKCRQCVCVCARVCLCICDAAWALGRRHSVLMCRQRRWNKYSRSTPPFSAASAASRSVVCLNLCVFRFSLRRPSVSVVLLSWPSVDIRRRVRVEWRA